MEEFTFNDSDRYFIPSGPILFATSQRKVRKALWRESLAKPSKLSVWRVVVTLNHSDKCFIPSEPKKLPIDNGVRLQGMHCEITRGHLGSWLLSIALDWLEGTQISILIHLVSIQHLKVITTSGEGKI